MREDKVNQFVIILMVTFISAIFLSMIKSFLLAIFLAGIFAAITRPVYLRLEKWLHGRYRLAAGLTLVLIFLVVLIPLVVLTTVVTGEAIKVSQSAMPWAKAQLSQPGVFTELLESMPFYEKIAPHSELILRKASEMVGQLSRWLVNNLSAVTMGAVSFIFTTFILFYTMYFFLIDGETLLERILYYLPMQDKDEQLMLDKFTSVTRATLKGTAVVGVLQGGLAGVAFMVVGIPSATFWGVIMVVLSIIPSVGTALVWIPAAVILAIGGAYGKAIGLALFCAVVVGSVDNLLRPVLVGKDTQMHELMILFGTLGGLFMFGMVGIIIGPIVAALFVTIWEIYGQAFGDILPDTGYVLRKTREVDEPDQDGGA